MASKTYVCFGCKNKFNAADMIEYQAIGTKASHRYCMFCYEEKKKKEWFANQICRMFGIKTPGPRIYSQRKRLNAEGFTDELIIKTLRYMFDVKHLSKNFESLGLVNTKNMEEALAYWKTKEIDVFEDPNAEEIKVNVKTVKAKKVIKPKMPEMLNPDDILGEMF